MTVPQENPIVIPIIPHFKPNTGMKIKENTKAATQEMRDNFSSLIILSKCPESPVDAFTNCATANIFSNGMDSVKSFPKIETNQLPQNRNTKKNGRYVRIDIH